MYTPNTLILDGAYRIERELGRGAFGIVYLATHQRLNVLRALKTLHQESPQVGSTILSDYRNRFVLEAQLAARLTHSNVIQVHDYVDDQGTPVCVMEYAPGGSLADLILAAARKGQLLAVDRVVALLDDCCAGLEAVHDQLDAVHRDIKPSNLLLDTGGRVKVADLGLAQVGGLNQSQRSLMASVTPPHPGTPNYSSPEHLNGSEPLVPTADVYALGCVAFELLTGQAWKSARRKIDSPRELRGEIPPWLDAIVVRMLAETPGIRRSDAADANKRYVDVSAVREALANRLAVPVMHQSASSASAATATPVAAVAAPDQTAASRLEAEIARLNAENGSIEAWDALVDSLGAPPYAPQLQPLIAKAFAGRGQAHRREGHTMTAISDLTRAIELDAGRPEFYGLRARVYADAAASKHLSGDFAKALADAGRAIALNPSQAAAYAARGEMALQAAKAKHPAGDFAQALTDLTQAIELAPRSADYHLLRAHCYRAAAAAKHPLGSFARALADHASAIACAPTDARYLLARAETIKEASYVSDPAGELERAIEDATAAIALEPEAAAGYVARGHLYQLSDYGDEATLDKAEGDLKCALELDPTSTAARANLARVYYFKEVNKKEDRDFEQVLALYSAVIQAEPQNAEHYRFRSDVYIRAENLEAALADATRAIALDPESGEGYSARSHVYSKLKRDIEALADALEAYKRDREWEIYIRFVMLTLFSSKLSLKIPEHEWEWSQFEMDYLNKFKRMRSMLAAANLPASLRSELEEQMGDPKKDLADAFHGEGLGSFRDESWFPLRGEAAYRRAIALEPDNSNHEDSLQRGLYKVKRYEEKVE